MTHTPGDGNRKESNAKYKKDTRRLGCGKCRAGVVDYIVSENSKHVIITIKKCSMCKYQYGLKEIFKADLTDFKPTNHDK